MADKVHKKIETWIQANISVDDLGKCLLAGLQATKISNKETVDDYAARLSYIDWIATNGGYVAEKKGGGGMFSMTPPTQEDVRKTFQELRPSDE